MKSCQWDDVIEKVIHTSCKGMWFLNICINRDLNVQGYTKYTYKENIWNNILEIDKYTDLHSMKQLVAFIGIYDRRKFYKRVYLHPLVEFLRKYIAVNSSFI